jgi:trimeric autotransporter adhesin
MHYVLVIQAPSDLNHVRSVLTAYLQVTLLLYYILTQASRVSHAHCTLPVLTRNICAHDVLLLQCALRVPVHAKSRQATGVMETVGLTVGRHPLGSIVLQFATAFHMVFAAAAQQATEALQTALSSSTSSSSDLQRAHSRASLTNTTTASTNKSSGIDVSTAKHACSTLRGGATTATAAATTATTAAAVHTEPLALSLRKAVALTADCLLCLHVTQLWRWPCLRGSDVSSELALEALISALTPHLPELWLLCLAVYQREDAALLERVTSLSSAHTSSSSARSSTGSSSSAKQTAAAAAAAAAAVVPLTETLGVPESCWPRSHEQQLLPSRDLLTGTTADDEQWQAKAAAAREAAAAADTAAAVEAYAAAARALAAVQAVACPLAKAQQLVATVSAACECAQGVHTLRYASHTQHVTLCS